MRLIDSRCHASPPGQEPSRPGRSSSSCYLAKLLDASWSTAFKVWRPSPLLVFAKWTLAVLAAGGVAWAIHVNRDSRVVPGALARLTVGEVKLSALVVASWSRAWVGAAVLQGARLAAGHEMNVGQWGCRTPSMPRTPTRRRRAGTRARSEVWARAEQEADLTLRLPGGVPMFFRRIPAGSFMMGSRGRGADEEPRHRVVITRDFYLGTFTVTQAQYRAVAASCPALADRPAPSDFKGARRPVENVSWDHAEEFLRWLTAWPGLPPGIACARLPTEAEWEYACRAGTETDYYTGDGEAALAGVGWYDANAGETTHAVDERPEQHPWGLYGMHGNVWEWCRDWYDPAAYRKRVDAVCDPEVREQGESRARVLRGGSWFYGAIGCRSAYRDRYRPDVRYWYYGFRVCLVRSPAAEREEAERGRGDGAPRDEAAESDRAGGAGGGTRVRNR